MWPWCEEEREGTWLGEIEDLFPVGERGHHLERLGQLARLVFGEQSSHTVA